MIYIVKNTLGKALYITDSNNKVIKVLTTNTYYTVGGHIARWNYIIRPITPEEELEYL